MYLDQLPDLSRARLIRARARGVAIRDGTRAVAVAFVADGSLLGTDTLVRFDVTQGQDPSLRLSEAFAATGARGMWFYGGDEIARRAAAGLDLTLRPAGAAFVRRADAVPGIRITLRAPTQRERMSAPELAREHAPGFKLRSWRLRRTAAKPSGSR